MAMDEIYKIKTWLEDTEYQDDDIWELVISIELSEKNTQIAQDYVQKWIDEDLAVKEMKNLILTNTKNG